MNKTDTAKLITMVSALDRQPTDQGMVEMWHRVLQEFTFEDCEAALIPAYKESKGYISARAVYAAVKKLREERATERMSLEIRESSESWEVSSCPRCFHGKALVTCLPCCRKIHEETHALSEPSRNQWIDENILA